MKEFFATFIKSISSRGFYRSVTEAPLRHAFWYYAKFVVLVALCTTVVFGLTLVPRGVHFAKENAPELVDKYYPTDLVVTVKKGEVSVNVSEPYIIPANEKTKEAFHGGGIENVLVIDTTKQYSKEYFESHHTLVLLTKDELVTQSGKGITTILNIPSMASFVVSRDVITSLTEKVHSSLGVVVPLGLGVTFLLLILGFVLYLIPVLFYAVIPLIVAGVRDVPLTYGGALAITLYAVLPGLLLRSLLNTCGYFVVPVALPFLIFLLIVVLCIRKEEQPTLFDGSSEKK